MNKIILYMFTTVDGFIAGPNGEFDDYEPSVEEMQFANGLFGAAGGIIFEASNELHGLRNVGTNQAVYYVIKIEPRDLEK